VPPRLRGKDDTHPYHRGFATQSARITAL